MALHGWKWYANNKYPESIWLLNFIQNDDISYLSIYILKPYASTFTLTHFKCGMCYMNQSLTKKWEKEGVRGESGCPEKLGEHRTQYHAKPNTTSVQCKKGPTNNFDDMKKPGNEY